MTEHYKYLMKQLLKGDDREDAHVQADEILCAVLLLHGEADLVKLYKKLRKWYG